MIVVAAGRIDGFPGRLGASLVDGVVFLFVCYFFISTPKERQDLRDLVRVAKGKAFNVED